DPRSQLLDFLAARRILLLLDGFEHLVGAASWLADLLADAPGLTLLVTSRERLRLSQEWVVPLEGLPFAAPDSPGAERPPAIELFEQRMAQARGDRALDGGERQAVEDICAQLEGHPLAIELAAAWCASLSPSEVLGEMQASTDFLAARLHDIPEAHRSLRAVFERSWALLTPGLREAFAALSVFRGSFEPDAAQAVSGAGWMELAALVDKSLVRRSPLGRYELHTLLREYAGEALRQDAAAARRARAAHAHHYLGLLRTAAPHLISAGMAPAREALARELPNLWLALEHAVGTFDDQTLLDALNDLLAFYVVYGWHEGALAFERLAQLIREARPAAAAQPLSDRVYRSAAARQAWFLAHLGLAGESRALSQPMLEWTAGDPSPEDRSLCLNNLGICACLQGEFDEGIERLNQAIEIGQGCAEPVFPSYHLWLGYIRFFQGRYHDSMADYQTCFDLFERQGNQLGMAFALSKMGLSADGMGSYDRGLAYHRQALDIFRATSHLSGQAYTYSRMSVDAYGLGDDRQAAEWAQAGLERFRTLSHRWGIGVSRCRLAFAQIGLGCLQEARSNLMAALARAREHEMAPLMAYAILGLACVRQAEGDPERAAWLSRAAAASPKTPPLYLELAARWLPGLAPPGPETTRPAAPTFEATQPADPSPDLEQMAQQLLQEALPGPDPS
ncbi:MAG: ATP-binding protein, partial [Anaerolineales bacterium]